MHRRVFYNCFQKVLSKVLRGEQSIDTFSIAHRTSKMFCLYEKMNFLFTQILVGKCF